MKRFQGETLGAVLSQWQAHAGLLSLQDNPPYDKGAFRIEINFPAEYPFKPPKITFKTKIYHPNIDEKGQVAGWTRDFAGAVVCGLATTHQKASSSQDCPLLLHMESAFKGSEASLQNQGPFWQYPGTILVVRKGAVGCYQHLVGGSQR